MILEVEKSKSRTFPPTMELKLSKSWNPGSTPEPTPELALLSPLSGGYRATDYE